MTQSSPLTRYLAVFLLVQAMGAYSYVTVEETEAMFEFVTFEAMATFQDSSWISQVPDEKNIFCPQTVSNLYSDHKPVEGYKNIWTVKNTATTPVVLLHVDPYDGREYSIANKNANPPQSDPQAILQPGQHNQFGVWEGHVFHVRELLSTGAMGEVLFQHQAGIVPISVELDVDCSNSTDPYEMVDAVRDQEMLEVFDLQASDRQSYGAYPAHSHLLGFRNRVKSKDGTTCPLNAYYALLPSGDDPTQKYKEFFAHHLGGDLTKNDYLEDFQSSTKYERSYIGHSYVFRLASDDDFIVEVYTLGETKITDCPSSKQQNSAKVGESEILVDVMVDERIDKDVIDSEDNLGLLNTTSSQRNFYIYLAEGAISHRI